MSEDKCPSSKSSMFEDEETFEDCRECWKSTPLNELAMNSNFASYGKKMICDRCADKKDKEFDSWKQDRE